THSIVLLACCDARARRVIENTFGIAAERWRVWRRPVVASPEKITSIGKAVCVLHNYLMIEEFNVSHEAKRYCPVGFVDSNDRFGNHAAGGWRNVTVGDTSMVPIHRQSGNNYTRDAKRVQEMLAEYFNGNDGEA
ncbi:Hypothetical predicted protein, partial [Paramuricea clavata]